MSHYIGPDRRQGERRRYDHHARDRYFEAGGQNRRNAQRRQEALSGVIAGLTAEQMQELAKAWQAREESVPMIRKEP